MIAIKNAGKSISADKFLKKFFKKKKTKTVKKGKKVIKLKDIKVFSEPDISIIDNISYSDIIKERKKKLEVVRERLKLDFDGLDASIDRFIGSITCWYCIPEVMERPLIICIWGMTGSGKTDLLRKFIKYLDFESKSCEITIDTNRDLSIKDRMEYSPLKENEPGILILDEIQRGRTIDENGEEDTESKINDLWSLLSDGKFSSHADRKEELLETLLQEKYDNISFPLDDEERLNPFKRNFFEAKLIKRKLSSPIPIEELMRMDEIEYQEFIRKEMEKPEFSRIPSYKKLLIVVVGNLDSAFEMANDVNTDHDADILHEYSKRINVITIKNALQELFKPEQIARFGNNHIIYPSFSKETYKKIIKRYLNESINRLEKSSKLTIKYDQTVEEVVFENGVYPSQGVRPVHSTIAYIISKIPDFIIHAYEFDLKTLELSINKNNIVSNFEDGSVKEVSIEKDIEKIKSKYDDDSKCIIALHESAHSIIYAILYKVAPLQIVISGVDNSCEGYILPHWTCGSKNYLEHSIKVLLAGYLAEEMFFGKEMRTSGCAGDIQMATETAASMIRNYGMGKRLSRQDVAGNDNGNSVFSNINISNAEVEKLLKKEEIKVIKLLKENIKFLKEVAFKLFSVGKISTQEFIEIAKNNGIICEEKKSDETISEKYLKIFNEKIK